MDENKEFVQETHRVEASSQDIATHRFSVGDLIEFRGIERRIIGIDQEGYFWEYPDIVSGDDNFFTSLNSSDPLLFNWSIKAR